MLSTKGAPILHNVHRSFCGQTASWGTAARCKTFTSSVLHNNKAYIHPLLLPTKYGNINVKHYFSLPSYHRRRWEQRKQQHYYTLHHQTYFVSHRDNFMSSVASHIKTADAVQEGNWIHCLTGKI